MSQSPRIVTRIAFFLWLILTLTFAGMSGHTARIKPTEALWRKSTPTPETSKLLPTARRSPNNLTAACDEIKPTSTGRTYYWRPEITLDFPKWTPSPPERPDWNPWKLDDVERGGVPGPGDTAVLKAGRVYLDQNRIIGTLIICGRGNTLNPPVLQSLTGQPGPYKLTVTDKIEWIEGTILDATVEAGENSDVAITEGSLGRFNYSHGFLRINGTGSISGPFTVTQGSTLTVEPKGELTISSASPVIVGNNNSTSTLDIFGTAIITGTGGIEANNLVAINVSGTLDLRSDAALSSNCECSNCECVMTVSAGGTLVKSAGNGISSIGLNVNNGLNLDNVGTVSAQSGTLAFSRSFTQTAGATILDGGNLSLAQSPFNLNGGTLAGSGKITGNVINAGVDVKNPSIVSPGYPESTAGQLTIEGDYTQGATAKLAIDIGGTADSQFDKITSNVASLSGTLDIRLINNFHPACNDSFDIVKYIARQSDFSVVNGIDLGSARNLMLDAQPDRLRLLAQGIAGQDTDNDGVSHACDNCPNSPNNDQKNFDHDREGDVCDNDDDNDGIIDSKDAFRLDATEWIDTDHDGTGDNADTDDDNDGVPDANDAFRRNPAEWLDTDGDDTGNGADADDDDDGLVDALDNCPLVPNLDQTDDDGDLIGNACDRVINPYTPEAKQRPHIVFSSKRDGNYEIYGMSADGTVIVRLTNSPGEDTEPALSPDRSKIAFTSRRDGNREIYWMKADGTEITRLTNLSADDKNPAWAPDGKKIVFVSRRDGGSKIYSIDVADCVGDCPIPVATRLNDQVGIEPAWSPNGYAIAFAGQAKRGKFRIFSMDSDGKHLRTLTTNIVDANNHHPTWSPDSSRIAFIRDFGRVTIMYTMNPDGSRLSALTLGLQLVFEPAWGMNGKLLFRANHFPSQRIYLVNSNGTGLRRLSTKSAIDVWPHW